MSEQSERHETVLARQEATLALRREGMTMAPDATISGHMTGADLKPLLYKLVQRTSREATEGVEPGMFVGAAEPKERIRCVVLRVALTRVLWPKEVGSGPPQCSSDDRVSPKPGGVYPGPCATCQKMRALPWEEAEPRGWCQPGATLLLWDLEEGCPFLLRVSGKAGYDPFREWLFRARLKPYYGRTWTFPTEVRSATYKGQKGTYEKMQFAVGTAFSPEEAAARRELIEALEGVLLTAPEAEVEEAVEGEAGPAPSSSASAPSSGGLLVKVRGEPELRYTTTGKLVCDVMAETPQGFRKLVVWDDTAERFNAEVKKDDTLMVTGRYGVRTWQDRDGGKREEPNLTISSFIHAPAALSQTPSPTAPKQAPSPIVPKQAPSPTTPKKREEEMDLPF